MGSHRSTDSEQKLTVLAFWFSYVLMQRMAHDLVEIVLLSPWQTWLRLNAARSASVFGEGSTSMDGASLICAHNETVESTALSISLGQDAGCSL